MWYVYILKSNKDKRFYTGITENIGRRLKQHNIGSKATKSTLKRGPFILVFGQECKDRKDARLLEKFLKSGIGREVRNELFIN